MQTTILYFKKFQNDRNLNNLWNYFYVALYHKSNPFQNFQIV